MQRVAVRTASGSYDVVVQRNSLEKAGEYLRPLIGQRQLFVVADETAWRHQGERFEAGLKGVSHRVLTFPGGEEEKRSDSVERLADRMYQAGADRTCCIAAFGGGVAGDISGFLAAIYMRGVDVIQVPTTLLAQVDAAIGGKTGVNLSAGKNILGAFHQPRLVLVDPTSLETLPDREYRAGLYEVIKYGIIWSRSLFDLLVMERDKVLARDPEVLEAIITESVRIKAEVVAKDEREGDLRRILNYGHTLGHALEAETGYSRFLHGEAVAFGMIAAAHLAESARLLTADDRQTIEEAVLAYGPIPALEGVAAAKLVERLRGDKKTVAGQVHFVLPTRIGHVQVVSGLEASLIQKPAETALRVQQRQPASDPSPGRQSVASP